MVPSSKTLSASSVVFGLYISCFIKQKYHVQVFCVTAGDPDWFITDEGVSV